jgi:hypothetical protein
MFNKLLQMIIPNPSTRLVFNDLAYSVENINKAKPGERLIDYENGHIYIKKLDGIGIVCKTLEMETRVGMIDVDAEGNLTYKDHIVWHAGIFNPDDYLKRSGNVMTGAIEFVPESDVDFTFMKLTSAIGDSWKFDYLDTAKGNSIKITSIDTNKSLELSHNGILSADELKTNLSKVWFGSNRFEYNYTDNLMELFIGDSNTGKVRYAKESEILHADTVILSPSGDNKLNVGVKNTLNKIFIGHTPISGYNNPSIYSFGDGTVFRDIEAGNVKSYGNINIVGLGNHMFLPNNSFIKGSLNDGSMSISLIGMNIDNKVTISDSEAEIFFNSNMLSLPVAGVTSLSKNTTNIEISDNDTLVDIKNNDVSMAKFNKTGIMDVLSGINFNGILIKKNTSENTLDIIFQPIPIN